MDHTEHHCTESIWRKKAQQEQICFQVAAQALNRVPSDELFGRLEHDCIIRLRNTYMSSINHSHIKTLLRQSHDFTHMFEQQERIMRMAYHFLLFVRTKLRETRVTHWTLEFYSM